MDDRIASLCREYLEYEEHPWFRKELEELIAAKDEDSVYDRFYTQLAFGTGGLRGIIGAGFNRMNPYMVKRATQGLCNYIKGVRSENPSAVIAYDSRRYSPEFAESAALVLCENGIKTYLFSSLRPTPELSYAVRELGATAGIVITASHNPPEYNGYKVYWEDGGQVVPPHDVGILEEVRKTTGKIISMERDTALKAGKLEYIDAAIDRSYLAMIDGYLTRRATQLPQAAAFKVVYTPLHGTGTELVEAVLDSSGVSYITVPEQREPDGNFPTVTSPNPEEASALRMALDLAEENRADLVMGTDPDSDRLGIAARHGDEMVLLTGNQLGSLLCDYVFATRKENGTLPSVPVLVKTIVTTELQRRIAESYGARVYDVLTGFKYIGEKIREFESTDEEYVFGGEESFGYLVETEARDKDAISTAALTVEMALYQKSRGKSLFDYLDELYVRFGYFEESLISKHFQGEEGQRKIEELMSRLRENPPAAIGGSPVVGMRDYSRPLPEAGLPPSNVLQFVLESGVVSARPSGTEPKIKFYVSCWEPPGEELRVAKASVGALVGRIEATIEEITG